MQAAIETLNRVGDQAAAVAWPMFWQSSLLITVMFLADWALRRRVRAAVRYALWWVVLLKLVLPPSLALPTSPSWWILSSSPALAPAATAVVRFGPSDMASPVPTSPATAFVPPTERLSAAGAVLAGTGSISLLLLMWILVRWRNATRFLRGSAHPPAWVEAMLEENRRTEGLRRPVRLCLVDRTISPAVLGLFRPVILVPKALVAQLSHAQLRTVLLHELVHLRRGDTWANCFQALLQIAYWWHPLLWLANARIRHLREEAVDDAVVSGPGVEAQAYAAALLQVAKAALPRPLATMPLVGILESRSFLRQRIERLLDMRSPRIAGLSFASTITIFAVGAFALPMGQPERRTVSDAAPGLPTISTAPPALAQSDPGEQFTTPDAAQELSIARTHLNIKAAFVELSEELLAAFWNNQGVTNAAQAEAITVLTPSQQRRAREFLNSNSGVRLLNEASVTTLSGRQTMIQAVDLMPVLTNINPRALSHPGVPANGERTNTLYLSDSQPCGPTLELLPNLQADGFSIQLGATTTTREFLGYDKPTNSVVVFVEGKRQRVELPVPRFRSRSATAAAVLRDGQTLLLKGLSSENITKYKDKIPVLGDLRMVGTFFRSESTKREKKHILVMITPTLVDPAGDRLHTDEQVEEAPASQR